MLRPTSTGRLTAAPSQTRSSRWGGPRIRSSASRMTAAVALRTERQRLAWMRLPALRGPPPTRRPVDPHPPRGRSMSSTSFAGQLTSPLRYRSARRLPICSLARTGGRAVRTRQCRGVGGVAPRRRWAGCLPVLVALLLALGSAAISGDTADAPRFGQVGTALAGVAASTHPAVASSRTETRLLAKRGESRAAGSPVAIGWAACRLAAPSGRWMTQGVAARSRIGERGDTYRGRGPPTGV